MGRLLKKLYHNPLLSTALIVTFPRFLEMGTLGSARECVQINRKKHGGFAPVIKQLKFNDLGGHDRPAHNGGAENRVPLLPSMLHVDLVEMLFKLVQALSALNVRVHVDVIVVCF